jgi:hypothetical protein
MRFFLLLLFVLPSYAFAEHNRLSPEQVAEGWISLFDGETFFGWQKVNDVDWQVVDGEIRATKGDIGWLMTTSEFVDYELHVEFKATKKTNSGVFLRSPLQPKDPAKDCFELNIAPQDHPFPTGYFVDRKGEHGGILKQINRANRQRGVPELDPWDGQWHTFDIVVYGKDAKFKLEGRWFEHVEGSIPSRGHIGLQFNQGKIAFRSIHLKPQLTKSIFNGKDLSGWNAKRADASHFEVTDKGELRVLDGRGQIESEASYGDFLLQLECFVDGDALNSGIFFRCIPGDFMMGYECQIHNGMKDDDPTKPADCGTGGFFRRQNARRIIAKDREWFAMTLVADGPHMAAWVDGQQVSDWTDTRKPHENPRKGLRLKAGTLAIQGHDPTTDLRFRKLRVVEMPEGR